MVGMKTIRKVILILVVILQVITMCYTKPTRGATALELAVNKCRTKCVYKFSMKPIDLSMKRSCEPSTDCRMCWDYCEMVPVGFVKTTQGHMAAKDMCNDKNFCLPGCQYACRYYRIDVKKSLASVTTNKVN